MNSFEPIDKEIINNQDHRLPREYLEQLASHGDDHNYPFSWGFVIFRTVYTPGSGEAFAKAMDRLGVYAKGFAYEDVLLKPLPNKPPQDLAPNQDLWRRYFNVIVEDRASLAEATVDEVGKRFDAWSKNNVNLDAKSSTPNSRYRYCLMIDQERIDNLHAMSRNPNVSLQEDPQQFDRWVEVVFNTEEPETGRFWLRVGISGFLRNLWFASDDPDAMIEYAACPDEADGILNYWGLERRDYYR